LRISPSCNRFGLVFFCASLSLFADPQVMERLRRVPRCVFDRTSAHRQLLRSELEPTLAACAASARLNLATAAALLPFGAQTAATAGMLSGFRSMALYVAVLPEAADPRLALSFGLYQIPLYLGPLVLAPGYRRLLLWSGERRA
jgi:hypothetical protein